MQLFENIDNMEYIEELDNTQLVSEPTDDDILFIKTEKKIVRINVKSIILIEAMGEYQQIYLEEYKRPVIVFLSMRVFEERLPSSCFIRVHRSYIINLHKMKEVKKGQILLYNDKEVPIGETYHNKFNNFLRDKILK